MRKAIMLVVAVSLSMAMVLPVLGMTVAAKAGEGDPLNVDILAPVKGKTSWYGGAAMPIRIHVSDPDNNGSSLVGVNATLWVDNNPATGIGRFAGTNMFREIGNGDYMFILDTKKIPAGPGSPLVELTITVKAPDDRTHDVDVMFHFN